MIYYTPSFVWIIVMPMYFTETRDCVRYYLHIITFSSKALFYFSFLLVGLAKLKLEFLPGSNSLKFHEGDKNISFNL